MSLPDKKRVLDAVVAHLTRTLEQLTRAARETHAGATHAEAKPENSKDTRALEQSYLARGQAARVEQLSEQIQRLRFMPLRAFGPDDSVEPGALLLLQGDDGERRVLLFPEAGGVDVMVDGVRVLVVTPASPMGRALVGKLRDDDVEVVVRGVRKDLSIVEVA
jgi:transcription elongation GreA/GreB family factor